MERCYLNSGCAKPWGIFPDLNHTISNMRYIIYGIALIIIVFYKSCMFPSENQPNTDLKSNKGMIQQHSLFYTLGLCMIMQGTFSIISHFCPSNISLQFDTTMMYMMMIPVFVKTYQTYQFRHPDTCACAYNAMYSFFLLLSLEAVSLYIERRELHHFIFYGAIKISYTATVPVLCSYISLPLSWPKIPNLLIGLYLLLISFALYFGTSGSPGAPNYLPLVSLATFIEKQKLLPAETSSSPAIKPQNVFICDAGEDKSSVIVVESIPAYNFGVVKYDYKILS